jgi:hypothetical protein
MPSVCACRPVCHFSTLKFRSARPLTVALFRGKNSRRSGRRPRLPTRGQPSNHRISQPTNRPPTFPGTSLQISANRAASSLTSIALASPRLADPGTLPSISAGPPRVFFFFSFGLAPWRLSVITAQPAHGVAALDDGKGSEHQARPQPERTPPALSPQFADSLPGRRQHGLESGRATSLCLFASFCRLQIQSLPEHNSESPKARYTLQNTRTRSAIEATRLRCVEAASFPLRVLWLSSSRRATSWPATTNESARSGARRAIARLRAASHARCGVRVRCQTPISLLPFLCCVTCKWLQPAPAAGNARSSAAEEAAKRVARIPSLDAWPDGALASLASPSWRDWPCPCCASLTLLHLLSPLKFLWACFCCTAAAPAPSSTRSPSLLFFSLPFLPPST